MFWLLKDIFGMNCIKNYSERKATKYQIITSGKNDTQYKSRSLGLLCISHVLLGISLGLFGISLGLLGINPGLLGEMEPVVHRTFYSFSLIFHQ